MDVTSRATYEAVDNFHTAVSNFFASCKGVRKGPKMAAPTFKKKGKAASVVRFSHSSQFSILGRRLKISGLKEEILCREKLRFKGKVKLLSIKFVAGKWYASFTVELDARRAEENTEAQKPRAESIGVDLGIKNLAVLSTGEVVENPKLLRKKLRLLRRRQRQVSRKFVRGQEQSKRYKVAAARVSRLHKKVADQRAAVQHKLTSDLVKRFTRIVIEDLQVKNMRKNHRLARSISDVGWFTIRRQLTYKSKYTGAELVVADKWFASSKTCSCCGSIVSSLTLKQRRFYCQSCGFTEDRDINAAVNLSKYTHKTIVATNLGETQNVRKSSRKTNPQGEAKSEDGVNINLQTEVAA